MNRQAERLIDDLTQTEGEILAALQLPRRIGVQYGKAWEERAAPLIEEALAAARAAGREEVLGELRELANSRSACAALRDDARTATQVSVVRSLLRYALERVEVILAARDGTPVA